MPNPTQTEQSPESLLALREKLMKENLWNDFSAFPKDDWRWEVGNRDTILGYWDWVGHKIECLRN